MRLKVTFTLWRETFTFTTCQNLGRWRQSIQKDSSRWQCWDRTKISSTAPFCFALPPIRDRSIHSYLPPSDPSQKGTLCCISLGIAAALGFSATIAKAQIRGAAVTRCVHCAHQNVKNNSTQGT